ncbi:2-oxo acid dehydrogenase subunit E2, partial [Capnocytophaga granulosa]
RAIVRNGQIVVAPVMYIALSYDHRLIDGRESVGFLVEVKKALENPVELLMNNDLKNALEL